MRIHHHLSLCFVAAALMSGCVADSDELGDDFELDAPEVKPQMLESIGYATTMVNGVALDVNLARDFLYPTDDVRAVAYYPGTKQILGAWLELKNPGSNTGTYIGGTYADTKTSYVAAPVYDASGYTVRACGFIVVSGKNTTICTVWRSL